ncbi:hypothetical protein [Streptomyces sp. NPDC020742]|uniref:COG1470 family protein n=1 Tax=unclassified Streptomyces TaxID=2593676 RepID=UPI0033E2230E
MPFRPRTVVRGAVLATAAVLLAPAAAGAAPADRGWSAAPAPGAGAEPGPQDRPYVYLEGTPGTVLTDRLALSNPTGRPVTVRLRGSGSPVGGWLRPASTTVRVPPRTRAAVPFTVTVPRGAAPGAYRGAVVADGGGGEGRRAVVPVHLRITGATLSALTVENVTVSGRGSAAVIRYTLVNRGNTTLTPRLAVRAEGVTGTLLRRTARTLPVRLRPGQSLDLTERWPDPPALDAVEVRLAVTAAGGAGGSATASYPALPWGAGIGAALVLVAGTAGLVAVRLRRRAGRPGDGDRGGQGGPLSDEPVADGRADEERAVGGRPAGQWSAGHRGRRERAAGERTVDGAPGGPAADASAPAGAPAGRATDVARTGSGARA